MKRSSVRSLTLTPACCAAMPSRTPSRSWPQPCGSDTVPGMIVGGRLHLDADAAGARAHRDALAVASRAPRVLRVHEQRARRGPSPAGGCCASTSCCCGGGGGRSAAARRLRRARRARRRGASIVAGNRRGQAVDHAGPRCTGARQARPQRPEVDAVRVRLQRGEAAAAAPDAAVRAVGPACSSEVEHARRGGSTARGGLAGCARHAAAAELRRRSPSRGSAPAGSRQHRRRCTARCCAPRTRGRRDRSGRARAPSRRQDQVRVARGLVEVDVDATA